MKKMRGNGKARATTLRCLSCVLLLLFTFTLFSISPSFSSVSTTTLEDRLAVFDDAWQTVYERYYDPAFHGVDWEAERAQFRPHAAQARTSAELYKMLRRKLG
jgi:hypothetical protein